MTNGLKVHLTKVSVKKRLKNALKRVLIDPERGWLHSATFHRAKVFICAQFPGTWRDHLDHCFKLKYFSQPFEPSGLSFQKKEQQNCDQSLTIELELADVHAGEVFRCDDRLLRAVLDCVGFVTVFTTDRTLVLSQNGAQDTAHRVLHGVRSVGNFAGAVVLAKDAMLQKRKHEPLQVKRK